MATTNLAQETYLPSGDEQAAKVYDFLAAHEAARGERPVPQYFLSGAETGDQVALPREVYEVVLKVVDAMRRGLAVSVAPQSQRLTTQQAVDSDDEDDLESTLESLRAARRVVSEQRRARS